jgi:DNA-binding LytR/AlgR family response regulator
VQQSLREDVPELRERTGPAVHASRPNPINARLLGRVLLVGTAIAVFLSLFGPFHAPLRTILTRDAQYFAYAWIGSLLGLLSARLTFRLGVWSHGPLAIGVATGVIMAPPMMLVVWTATALAAGRPPPMRALPDMLWPTFLICVGASILAVMINRNRHVVAAATSPTPPKFLERVPLKLRGGELWAVEAEDHYLRLHTSKGQDLILLRLADAIDELEGVEGAQVHRSWWVARDAIADARRGDGRATLTLKDGSEVPVSRTYARILREKNWI